MAIITAPVSDMQRRGAALVAQAREVKEPIYLTKHGRAQAVLIDVEEYEHAEHLRERERARQEYLRERHEGIARGLQDFREGNYVSWREMRKQLIEQWGDDFVDDIEDLEDGE